jgi:RNA recognition motif-containing protein
MNIYVGNLSLEITEEELRQEFAVFGEVSLVTVMNDKYIGSGQSKGYAFVEMPSQPEGQAAITALNQKALRHMIVNVIEARPLSDHKGEGYQYGVKLSRYMRKTRERSY